MSLLDIDGAAEFLGVKRSWVRDKVTARAIPFTLVGRHVRFSEEDLAAIVAAGRQRPTTPAPRLSLVPVKSRRSA